MTQPLTAMRPRTRALDASADGAKNPVTPFRYAGRASSTEVPRNGGSPTLSPHFSNQRVRVGSLLVELAHVEDVGTSSPRVVRQ